MENGTRLYAVRSSGEDVLPELETVIFIERSLAAPECIAETWLCRRMGSGELFRCSVGSYHRTSRGAWLEYRNAVENRLSAMNREREDLNRRMRFAQGSQLVKVRDEYMPVIALEKIFQVPRFDLNKTSNIMVVVEADGSRVALLVDELLGQHQVVVKNLESNYRKVPNVSGATILGDGTVALILDIGGLVRRARH